MSDGILIEGTHCHGTRQRVRIDPNGATVTLVNIGPAILEHSATADGGTPTTIAAGASGTITTPKFLRSQGQSQVTTPTGRFDLYVASA
jgi:hypothetical protein